MGLCLHQGVSEEDKKARGHSSKIEQDLCDEQAKRETNVVKILLLGECCSQAEKVKAYYYYYFLVLCFNWSNDLLAGPAESGKSTLVKQMKLIHSCGFTKQELISFKVPLFSIPT